MTRKKNEGGASGPDGSKRPTRPAGGALGIASRSWIWLGAILLFSATLRLVYLQEVRQAPDFSAPEVDAGFHDYWARGLAFGDWSLPEVKADPQIRTSPYFRPPAYPYFLAAVYRIAGPGYLGPRIAQIVVGLLGVFLAFLTMRRWLGDGAGLVAAGLTGAYWLLIYYEGEFLEGPLMVLGVLGVTYLLLGWLRHLSWRIGILTGVVCGIAALIRPNALLFLPAALVWAWWVSRRLRDRRFLTVGMPAMALGLAAAILPVTIRNYAVSGQLVWITSNAGINLYMGNNERADGLCPGEIAGLGPFDTCYDYPPLVAKLERQLGRPLDESQVSRYFAGRALDFIRTNPGRVLQLLGRKTLLFWGPLEVSHNKVEEAERENSPLLRVLPVRFPVAFALALLGAGLLWITGRKHRDSDVPSDPLGPDGRAPRERRAGGTTGRPQLEATGLVSVLILTWWLSFLPFFVAARYRAPIVPLLLGFAAFAIWRLWTWARTRDLRRAGLALAAGVVLFAIVSVNWAHYHVDRARWHYARGRGFSNTQRYDQAATEFQEALEINPDFSSAHVDLGVLLAMRQQWDESYRHLSRAAELEPDNPFAQQNLGGVLEVQGHLEDAR
ncbi:MAG: glycosyltransferase family 39 protein [Candidatus Eisenbacteria bacterium]|uniref:Glycosyltransferase family 39 protein n=1 Tax=Eiseniibacteriota bacterium TaxID=2212470 RepID=A0A956M086_UNCEI|nr:glycosyltransferase family 39 protein [Candidatus Eisenbacteria bacterium]